MKKKGNLGEKLKKFYSKQKKSIFSAFLPEFPIFDKDCQTNVIPLCRA